MRRHLRRRSVRWALAALGAVLVGYLVGVNVLLNIGFGRALVNLRPGSVRLTWSRAWTLWPGHLAVRGFLIEGRMRSRAWRVSIDRAQAGWSVWRLLRRELRFDGLRAEGVQTRLWRVSYTPPPGMKPTGGPAVPVPGALRTWRFTFDDIQATKVGNIELFGVIVDCAGGEASGSFGYQLAGKFQVDGARAHCGGAGLAAGDLQLVRDARIDAEADLAPYSPREHPGMAGFDFLTGRLQARGVAEANRLLAKVAESVVAPTATAANETLVMDLQVEDGALTAGSVLRIDGGSAAPSLALEVTAEPLATAVSFAAPGLEIAGREAARPLLASGPVSFSGSTPERRLSKLFAVARDRKRGAPVVDIGLRGLLEMAEPRLTIDSARAAIDFDAARVSGTIDVAALMARQLMVEGLRVENGAFKLQPKAEQPAERGLGSWTIGLWQAKFEGLREVTVGDQRFVGPFDALLTGGFSPLEGVELEQLTLDAPRLDVFIGGQPASRNAKLGVELSMALTDIGSTSARGSMRQLSGRVQFAGRVASLGWLQRYLGRLATLQVEGSGDVVADVAVRGGRLEEGSQLRLTLGRMRAAILDSVATGDATLLAKVAAVDGKPRAGIDVVFSRYGMASADGERDYLRGSNLRLRLASGDLDLADLVEDLTARVEAKGAEIPDLRAYNSYLPAGAGVDIQSGTGRLDLLLDLDHAAGTARGGVVIHSTDVALGVADVTLRGVLHLDSKLRSTDLAGRRFDLDGTRLELVEVALVETGEDASESQPGWWATVDLTKGHVDLRRPLGLEARLDMRMRDSGLLLSLASRRSRFLSWFGGVLDEEDVIATGQVTIDGGSIRIDPLRAEGGKVDLRARMHMAKDTRRIDVFLRHGHLAAGLELRDGKRDIKLLRPEAWYESRDGFD